MAHNKDWLPTRREDQLAMAMKWLVVMAVKKTDWKILDEDYNQFQNLVNLAQAALHKAQTSDRTWVITAELNTAFETMIAEMRYIKRHYFDRRNLLPEDYYALGLSPYDNNATPVPSPGIAPELSLSSPGQHRLTLYLRPQSGAIITDPRSLYAFDVRMGVLPYGGASPETAYSRRELLKAPERPEDLPNCIYTRRHTHDFDYLYDQSGATSLFSARYLNYGGAPGPWSGIISRIIP